MLASDNTVTIMSYARKKHIRTNEELAERLGMTRTTLWSKIKNPKKHMTLGEAEKMCKLLEMPMDVLMSMKGGI